MRKYIIISAMLMLSIGVNGWDIFGVYKNEPPQECSGVDITAEDLTLEDLTAVAICNNPALSADYMALKAKEAALGAAKSGYLPSIEVNGEGSLKGEMEEDKDSVQNEPYSAGVALSWLIYDFGGRSSNIKLNKAYLTSAEHAYDASLQETVLKVHSAYLRVLGAQASLESAQSTMKTYRKSFEESSKRYELGMVSLVDKLQAKTTYEQSVLSVTEAENTLKQNEGNLAVLLNLPPDTQLKLKKMSADDAVIELESGNDIKELMNFALKNRPEIKQKQSDVDAGKAGITSARSSGLPSLSAVAQGSYDDNWKRDLPYKRGSSVGLKLSWPIFSGFNTSYSVSKAKYEYEQSKESLEDTKISVLNEVWSYYQNYNTAVKSYEISKQILATAEENERVAFRYYEVGKIDILNLLMANSQLADARQGLVNAFYGLLISKADLYRAIGRF